jgi:acyl-CoA hydrolase
MVEVRARVVHTGVTGIHMAVDVSTRDPQHPEGTGHRSGRVRTIHCVIVFVALDSQGNATPVPVWQPSGEEDIALEQYAIKLMQLSKAIEKELNPYECIH